MFDFLKNITKLDNNDPSIQKDKIEYEVRVAAPAIGQLSYGPYRLSLWDFPPPDKGNQLLCLQLEKAWSTDEIQNFKFRSVPKDGYYHGGGIADELISLISLALGRWMELGSSVRFNNQPQRETTDKSALSLPFRENQVNLGDASEFLELLSKMPEPQHQSFILAARLYHLSISLIESQPDIAYINLVSCIESLLSDTIVESKIESFDSKLASLITQISDLKLREEIENRILKREKFIKRRFIKFMTVYSKDFWQSENRPEFGRIEENDFPRLLGLIYDARSSFLHTGKPFPAFALKPSKNELEFGEGIIMQGRRWDRKDFLPNVTFFAKITGEALRAYVKHFSSDK